MSDEVIAEAIFDWLTGKNDQQMYIVRAQREHMFIIADGEIDCLAMAKYVSQRIRQASQG